MPADQEFLLYPLDNGEDPVCPRCGAPPVRTIVRPVNVWKKRRSMRRTGVNVVHMIQIADDMTFDIETPDDQETWNRFSFALRHGRLMLEAFQRCYDEQDFGTAATVVGVV
jgi:hypothetical protein